VSDPVSFLFISAGIFAGAVVSGLVGFAFSAVAGAILLHILPPTEAVPLMMACSIVTQAVSLLALRGTVQWRGHPCLIVCGLAGMLPAVYLLHHVDAHVFRIGFGIFLVLYAVAMLLRPRAAIVSAAAGCLPQALVGFGGGVVGGLTAMPGALPSMWCELRGLPKCQQRGLVQPYIATLQLAALAVMLAYNTFSSSTLLNMTLYAPALAAGAALGVVLFHKVDDALFRSTVLAILLVAGVLLAI